MRPDPIGTGGLPPNLRPKNPDGGSPTKPAEPTDAEISIAKAAFEKTQLKGAEQLAAVVRADRREAAPRSARRGAPQRAGQGPALRLRREVQEGLHAALDELANKGLEKGFVKLIELAIGKTAGEVKRPDTSVPPTGTHPDEAPGEVIVTKDIPIGDDKGSARFVFEGAPMKVTPGQSMTFKVWTPGRWSLKNKRWDNTRVIVEAKGNGAKGTALPSAPFRKEGRERREAEGARCPRGLCPLHRGGRDSRDESAARLSGRAVAPTEGLPARDPRRGGAASRPCRAGAGAGPHSCFNLRRIPHDRNPERVAGACGALHGSDDAAAVPRRRLHAGAGPAQLDAVAGRQRGVRLHHGRRPAYVNPDNFIGYPEIVGNALRLDAVNPSCPGETTAGFLSLTGADNGCRLYRSRFPLHESYSSTQLDFALAYLGANRRRTKLVTLSLGANDGFLLIAACNNDPACIQANLPAALAAVFANLNTILGNLRATRFNGVLMVVNYYSTDYSDPNGTALTMALNQTLAAAAGEPRRRGGRCVHGVPAGFRRRRGQDLPRGPAQRQPVQPDHLRRAPQHHRSAPAGQHRAGGLQRRGAAVIE
jgi:hypothetical protein